MSDNATRTLTEYLGGGEPMTAKAISEELGISRQHLNTLILQVQAASAHAIPHSGGRRQYTTALRDLLLEVRQSALPTTEALTAILPSYGVQMPQQPATEDRRAELECRVQALEATVAEQQSSLLEFAAWARQINAELDDVQTRLPRPVADEHADSPEAQRDAPGGISSRFMPLRSWWHHLVRSLKQWHRRFDSV